MAKERKTLTPQDRLAALLNAQPSLKFDLICIALLYALTLLLFRGIVFDNAAFSGEGDTAAAQSYAHAGERLHASEKVDIIWMPYFFSGMPTFGNVAYLPHNVNYLQDKIVEPVLNLLFLGGKWTWMIVYYLLAGTFMFLLMRTMSFTRASALLGSFIVMLSPHFVSLASEGHGTKLEAVAYLPLVFLLTHYLFEKRSLLAFGALAAAIGTLLLTNHMQIVYYVFIVMGLYLLYQIVLEVRTAPKSVAVKTILFLGALVLGFCISSYIYLSVYEYSQFSMRGGGTAGTSGGLAWDYATNWSWHPQELMTLVVPAFFGMSSPYYWGTMPLSNAPIYVGIVAIILTAVVLTYRRSRLVIFFAILAVIVFLISFGKHFPVLYQLMFDYLPFFNKFRAPSMVLQILPFIAAFLAGAGLDYLLDREKIVVAEKLSRTLLIIAAVFAGVLMLLALTKTSLFQTLSGSMLAKTDELALYRQQYGDKATQIMTQLKQMRFDMLWKDLVKFVILAAVTLTLISFYLKKKVALTVFAAGILLITAVDLIIVINKGNYISPKPQKELEEKFLPDATTTFLQRQPGLFRVFPLGDLFMDNTYAYHGIQSIGGYSPAKLKIYQTLLDSCLYHGPEPGFALNMNIVNMLNTEFMVAPGRLPEDRFTLVNTDEAKGVLTYRNPHALPRAFFVKDVRYARNQTEVFALLNSAAFDAGTMAVLENAPALQVTAPDSASAQVTDFQSRHIAVKTYTSTPALMVLSEVYYPAGWKAVVDGIETPIYRTNSILRSVVVPAGTHELVFSFDPPMYAAGYLTSNIAWAVVLLCICIGLWQTPAVRARLKKQK
jgi:hypothetical protein